MRRRAADEKPEGLDRWLLTYADMITLLMAFFIMMYSMSVLNVSKFRQAAISIRSGFGGLLQGQGRTVVGRETVSPAGVPWRLLRPLVQFASTKGSGMTVGEDARGLVITMQSDTLLFESGSAVLRAEALPALDKVADVLSKTPNQVQIAGHTCKLAPRGGRYATNWELSTARATGVLRYLVESRGLKADRFSAAGYGSCRPVASQDNEADRARNRRVEIVVLRPDLADSVPGEAPRVISDPARVVIRRIY